MKPIFVIVTQFPPDFNRFFQMCKAKFPVTARFLSLHLKIYAAVVSGEPACEAVELSAVVSAAAASVGAAAVADCPSAF